MELFDKDGNLIGEIFEKQKDDISSSGSCLEATVAILKAIPLILLALILWLIIKAISIPFKWLYIGIKFLLKWIGKGMLWLLKILGVGCLYFLKLLCRSIWWLLRLPFYLIRFKKKPTF